MVVGYYQSPSRVKLLPTLRDEGSKYGGCSTKNDTIARATISVGLEDPGKPGTLIEPTKVQTAVQTRC